jgi:hypothetical protein
MGYMAREFQRTKAEAIDMAALGHALMKNRDRTLQPHTMAEAAEFDEQYAMVLGAAELLTKILTEGWSAVEVAAYTRHDFAMLGKLPEAAGRVAAVKWLYGGPAPYEADPVAAGMRWFRQVA